MTQTRTEHFGSDFLQELGTNHGGTPRAVAHWIEFDDIGSDDAGFQRVKAGDGVAHRHSPWLPARDARHKGGIEHINVEGRYTGPFSLRAGFPATPGIPSLMACSFTP